jgi:hypothetical protein
METRGRGAYRLLWIAALIAIGAQLAMARRPAAQPLAPVTRWTTYNWSAASLRIACPQGWKQEQQASGWVGGQEMVISASADDRLSIRRSPLRGAESVLMLRSAAVRRRTLVDLQGEHLRSLRARWPGLTSSPTETGQVASNFAAWCDVAYTRPAAWGGKPSRVLGKCYTIIYGDDQFWLDFFGDEQDWGRVLAPAYAHMLESLEFVQQE